MLSDRLLEEARKDLARSIRRAKATQGRAAIAAASVPDHPKAAAFADAALCVAKALDAASDALAAVTITARRGRR